MQTNAQRSQREQQPTPRRSSDPAMRPQNRNEYVRGRLAESEKATHPAPAEQRRDSALRDGQRASRQAVSRDSGSRRAVNGVETTGWQESRNSGMDALPVGRRGRHDLGQAGPLIPENHGDDRGWHRGRWVALRAVGAVTRKAGQRQTRVRGLRARDLSCRVSGAVNHDVIAAGSTGAGWRSEEEEQEQEDCSVPSPDQLPGQPRHAHSQTAFRRLITRTVILVSWQRNEKAYTRTT